MGCGHPYATLETQRRMHPSIAQLVRDTLYPNLEDAPSVSEYPEVMGMRKRLFWLDHRVPENDSSEADGNSTSHWNSHEIKMTLALVNHLFQQGEYKEQDIAVGADSVPWTASQAAPGTRKIPCFNARGARPRGSRKSWLRGRSKGEVE
jgi:hypothetical protein